MTKEFRRQTGLGALLVVLLVFFLALVAPGLFDWRDTREASKRTDCLSHAKEIATAILMYTDDNDEAFPATRVGSVPSLLGWASRLQPYPESRSALEWTRVFHDSSDSGLGMSYAMNANLAGSHALLLIPTKRRAFSSLRLEELRTQGTATLSET